MRHLCLQPHADVAQVFLHQGRTKLSEPRSLNYIWSRVPNDSKNLAYMSVAKEWKICRRKRWQFRHHHRRPPKFRWLQITMELSSWWWCRPQTLVLPPDQDSIFTDEKPSLYRSCCGWRDGARSIFEPYSLPVVAACLYIFLSSHLPRNQPHYRIEMQEIEIGPGAGMALVAH